MASTERYNTVEAQRIAAQSLHAGECGGGLLDDCPLVAEHESAAIDLLDALADAELCRCGISLASHQCTHCHDDPPRGHACPCCARPAGHVGPWRPVEVEGAQP